MKIKATFYHLHLCCQELGLRKNAGKKVVADFIRTHHGIEGNSEEILMRYATILADSGCKLKRSYQNKKRIDYSLRMKKCGEKLAIKNKEKQETPAVRAVESELIRLGIPYVREKAVTYRFAKKEKCVKIYILDFYLPKPINCIIEVDGSSHIGKESYDKERDARMVDKGLGQTVRIWNSSALKSDFNIMDHVKHYKFAHAKINSFLKIKVN